jgi:hypothetical protein
LNKLVAVAVLVAGSVRVQADGLGDLRSVLASLPARVDVRAAVTIETHSQAGDDDAPDAGKATIEAEHGAQGLRVTYANEVIAVAQQEARAQQNDPEKQTPTRTAISSVDGTELMDSLDAGAALTRRLANAKLVKDARVTASGRNVRQLTLRLEPKLSRSDAKRVKSLESTLVVNLDERNVPLSADVRTKVKARFLLMSFESEQVESLTLARAGDRLVALRRHQQSTGSGMGQKFSNRTTTTLTLR